jgi:hypothetical protein
MGSDRTASRISSIRQELRERLMADRTDGVGETLARLWALADGDQELLGEHARWAVRFELLSHAATA